MTPFARIVLFLGLAPSLAAPARAVPPGPQASGGEGQDAATAQPAASAGADDPARAVPEWIAARASAWSSSAADGPLAEDLASLASALEGVRVVGLGAATHGSAEFFTARDRILRHLVREQGFRVLAFESLHAGSRVVDDYVRGGESTLDQALAALGQRIWRVEELADTLRWLREHNLSVEPTERVRFVGVDMQGVDRLANRIAGYLGRVDLDRFDGEAAFYGRLGAAAEAARGGASDSLGRYAGELDLRLADFALKRGRYVARSSVAEYQRVLKDLTTVAQFVRAFGGEAGRPPRPDARDRFLADNVLGVLADEPTAKVVFMAHDVHVQRGAPGRLPPDQLAAGEYLARDLGSAYYALGTCFGEGAFQVLERTDEGAWQFALREVGPPPPGTVEWAFVEAGLGDAFLDLRGAVTNEVVRAWLEAPRGLRSAAGHDVPANVGERWQLAGNAPICVPLRDFDGLLFVARTRRATPLP